MKKQNMYPKMPARAFAAAALGLLLGGCGDSPSDSASGDSHGHHGHGHADEEAGMAGFIGLNHTHDSPGETCFICDASKRDKGRLWCREHGRYEDRCWMCHPELEDKDRLYCREHALYEDECFLCHPELKGDQAATDSPNAAATTVAAKAPHAELWCNEHGVAERECGICQPDLAAGLQPGENLKVRLPSTASADKAGIRTARPTVAEVRPLVSAYCETQYNRNALAKVTPLVDGVIRAVFHDVGEEVQAGQPLVELHSAAVAAAKSDYLSALVQRETAEQTFQRQKRLQAEDISAEKDLLKAEADLRSARLAASNFKQKLINLGLTFEEIDRVEQNQDTSAQLMVRAPFAGTLVARSAVMGESVSMGQELFTVADLSTQWLKLSIPADSIGRVKVGQPVEATFAELPGAAIKGRISWIDTSIDPQTRMVQARAVVSPEGLHLTTGLFGKATIAIGETQNGALLPRSAVQRHQGADFVFVRDSADLFALRRVQLGNARGDRIEVLDGLSPSDAVVTEGSFIAMSEFLKSRLGAGCVH